MDADADSQSGSESDETIDYRSLLQTTKNETKCPPLVEANPPTSNTSNFSVGSILSVEDLSNIFGQKVEAPEKLVSLENKQQFLQDFSEYKNKGGSRTVKSLIGNSLLKISLVFRFLILTSIV